MEIYEFILRHWIVVGSLLGLPILLLVTGVIVGFENLVSAIETIWHRAMGPFRFFLRSASTFGISLTCAYTLWVIYYFYVTSAVALPPHTFLGWFTHEFIWRNLAYFVAFYLFFEYQTAAMSAITAGASIRSKIGAATNVLIPVVPFILLIVLWARSDSIGITGEKLEHLHYNIILSLLDFVGGFAIAFMVAGRLIGFGGSAETVNTAPHTPS